MKLNKYTVRKIIGIIVILAGVSIISAALYMQHVGKSKQSAMIEDFEKNIAKQDNDNSSQGTSNTIKDDKSVKSAIAILSIPKIDLKVAVAEGTDLETLKYAVGHFTETAEPGQKGNFCVAGHRSYTYSEFFNRLNEVGVGDEIEVKTKTNDYKYKVYKIQVVTPDKVSVLNPTSDSEITLVTCTPLRVGTHRLIVKGKLE